MIAKQIYCFYGFVAGVMLTMAVAIMLTPKEREPRILLRMTLEDGRRMHLPVSPTDEWVIERNGGEVKIKSLEFRKKE